MFNGMSQIVQQLLEAKPFKPFELTCGNEGYVIADAELAPIVDEDYRTLAIYDPKSEQTNFINLSMVHRIQIQGRRF